MLATPCPWFGPGGHFAHENEDRGFPDGLLRFKGYMPTHRDDSQLVQSGVVTILNYIKSPNPLPIDRNRLIDAIEALDRIAECSVCGGGVPSIVGEQRDHKQRLEALWDEFSARWGDIMRPLPDVLVQINDPRVVDYLIRDQYPLDDDLILLMKNQGITRKKFNRARVALLNIERDMLAITND